MNPLPSPAITFAGTSSAAGRSSLDVTTITTAESDPVVYVDGIATDATYERGYLRLDNVPAGCHVLSLEPGDGPGRDSKLTDVCPDGYAAPDVSAPVVMLATDPSGPSGENGWFTGPVKVSATATDDASGVASLEYGFDDGSWTSYTTAVDAPEGETTYLFRATDRAGNVSDTQAVTVRRDATAPELSWSGELTDGAPDVFGSVPEAPTCAAHDTLSGEAGSEVSGYSTAVGTHTLTATARDLAGNETTATRTYTVSPWRLRGFHSPVDMDGVVNASRPAPPSP